MKDKEIVKNIIITIILITFVITYSMSFYYPNYQKTYYQFSPNYEKEYKEITNTYEIIEQNYNYIPAEIINVSLNKINNLIVINKGIKDKVKNNAYVVDKDGLVGIVLKSYNNYAIVRTINSSKINIPVEINECFGTMKMSSNKLIIDDLVNCDDINVNDPIFTSKYSISMANIPIGNVKKINKNKIDVKYKVNPYKLKYVGVIYDNN